MKQIGVLLCLAGLVGVFAGSPQDERQLAERFVEEVNRQVTRLHGEYIGTPFFIPASYKFKLGTFNTYYLKGEDQKVEVFDAKVLKRYSFNLELGLKEFFFEFPVKNTTEGPAVFRLNSDTFSVRAQFTVSRGPLGSCLLTPFLKLKMTGLDPLKVTVQPDTPANQKYRERAQQAVDAFSFYLMLVNPLLEGYLNLRSLLGPNLYLQKIVCSALKTIDP